MPSPHSDRNLLFGVVALQMNFIGRDELIDAMHEWIKDKTQTLGEILLARRALAEDVRVLLDGLVARHVEQHDGDLERSLASFFSISPSNGAMVKIPDPQLANAPA